MTENLNFMELVKKSGDSELHSYDYSNGHLTIQLYVDQLDIDAAINIKTDFVRTYHPMVNKFENICFIQITDLLPLLEKVHGYFVPPSDFGKMMKDVRNGYSMAYGKKPEEGRWLISLVGYYRLIICLVAKLDDITWKPIEVNKHRTQSSKSSPLKA